MSSELLNLFRKAFGAPRLERAVPIDTFFMSLTPVVNGWKRGQNELTGRVYWYNRAGRVRRSPQVRIVAVFDCGGAPWGVFPWPPWARDARSMWTPRF